MCMRRRSTACWGRCPTFRPSTRPSASSKATPCGVRPTAASIFGERRWASTGGAPRRLLKPAENPGNSLLHAGEAVDESVEVAVEFLPRLGADVDHVPGQVMLDGDVLLLRRADEQVFHAVVGFEHRGGLIVEALDQHQLH